MTNKNSQKEQVNAAATILVNFNNKINGIPIMNNLCNFVGKGTSKIIGNIGKSINSQKLIEMEENLNNTPAAIGLLGILLGLGIGAGVIHSNSATLDDCLLKYNQLIQEIAQQQGNLPPIVISEGERVMRGIIEQEYQGRRAPKTIVYISIYCACLIHYPVISKSRICKLMDVSVVQFNRVWKKLKPVCESITGHSFL